MKRPGKIKQILLPVLAGMLSLCAVLCACTGADTGEWRSRRSNLMPAENEAVQSNDGLPAGPVAEETAVRISEVMASNKSTLADQKGDFGDWLELFNAGDQPVQSSCFHKNPSVIDQSTESSYHNKRKM